MPYWDCVGALLGLCGLAFQKVKAKGERLQADIYGIWLKGFKVKGLCDTFFL